MGLFDKKYCDICGNKIGLLGNRKLNDGNLCKECASKLSPWFSERRQSSVDEIREQLEYRAQNEQAVAAFNTTRSYGTYTKILLDEDNQKFMVTSATNLAKANPDVMDYSQITGCRIDIEDSKDEIYTKDSEGNNVSYNPPQYEYSYDFYVVLNINSPYFNEIKFKLNNSDITIKPDIQVAQQAPAMQRTMPSSAPTGAQRPGMPAGTQRPGMPAGAQRPGMPAGAQRPGMPAGAQRPGMPAGAQRPGMPAAAPQRPGMGAAPERIGGARPSAQPVQQPLNQVISSQMMDPMYNAEYARFYQMGEDIKAALLGVHQDVREQIAAANEVPTSVICPWCGATTSTETGMCVYCNGSLN